MRVMATGEKSFFVEFRDRGGRKRQLGWPKAKWGGPLTVEQQRDEARKILAADDPIEKQRKDTTLAEVANLYLADLMDRAKAGAKRGRLSSHTWASGIFRRHVPDALKRRKVEDVTTADVKATMKRLADAGHAPTADHLRTVMHAVLEFARGEGLVTANAADGAKKYRKPGKKRRALTLDELAKLGEVLRIAEATGKVTCREKVTDKKGRETEKDVERPVARQAVTALRLLALTGMRRSELLGHMSKKYRGPREGLRWGDVDLDAATYTLAAVEGGSGGKGGEPRVLPLGKAAVELLESLRPEDADPDAPVVPSVTDPAEPFVGIDKPRRRLYAAAGITNADGHSLRHCFETTAYKAAPAFAGMLTGRAFTRDAVLNDYIDPSDPEILAEARRAADAVAGRIAQALDGKLADVLTFEKGGENGR